MELADRYPLFIASNGQSDYLQAIAEMYQLTKWVKGIYSIDFIASGNKSALVAAVLQKTIVKVAMSLVTAHRIFKLHSTMI